MKDKVKEVLNQVRPFLQRDGGDVDFVDIDENGIVKVKLKGACGSCPGALYTLKNNIERILKQKLPEIKEVIRVDN